MADEKKPPAFDPEKTIVDVRRPESPKPSPASGDKTASTPVSRPTPSPADDDLGRTVVITRPRPEPPKTPTQDADKTVIRRGPAPSEGDKTVVRSATGAVPAVQAAASGFEVICLSGQARGRRFPIPGSEAVVGSNPSCQIILPGIEGVHAKLQKQDDSFEIQNLGSKGSIVINGRRIVRTKLKSGDLAKIGEVVVRFVQAGDVFSSDYTEAELSGGGIGRYFDPEFLKENPRVVGLGVLAVALVFAVLFWPTSQPAPTVQQQAGPTESEKQRLKEIESLLATGEVLFKDGKLIAPPEQPEQQNAFAKFNEVLALDPGNDKALAWLKKIDEERDKQRRAREEEDQRRLALERQRREREHQELERKVNAILAEGDALYDRGEVAEPAGRNALVRYRQALQVDPESAAARDRVQKAVRYYVDRGDRFRAGNDLWSALENFRKASRAAAGSDPEIENRVREVEAHLRSGMASTGTRLILYKDDRGQLFVLDEMDKVPSRYRDRAVVVEPAGASK